ncbi:hypothetical protein K438DRAFT_1628663, partial [Mycena galopus ATCC 62051]
KNARSKRALDARLPKQVEDPRTTLFVCGTHTGQILNDLKRDLMAPTQSPSLRKTTSVPSTPPPPPPRP